MSTHLTTPQASSSRATEIPYLPVVSVPVSGSSPDPKASATFNQFSASNHSLDLSSAPAPDLNVATLDESGTLDNSGQSTVDSNGRPSDKEDKGDSGSTASTTVPVRPINASGKTSALMIKTSMNFKSPLTRAKAGSTFFTESEKLRKVHKVYLAARRRAAAEERLSKKRFKETKLLDIAQTSGLKWTVGSPGLAYAVATAAKETLLAEREALKLKLKEFLEQVELLRLTEDEVEEYVLDAETQVQFLRDLYRSQGLKEEDMETVEVEDLGSPVSSSSSLLGSPIRMHNSLADEGSDFSAATSSASSESSYCSSSSSSSSSSSPSSYKSAATHF